MRLKVWGSRGLGRRGKVKQGYARVLLEGVGSLNDDIGSEASHNDWILSFTNHAIQLFQGCFGDKQKGKSVGVARYVVSSFGTVLLPGLSLHIIRSTNKSDRESQIL
jgi:hypothetical protein